MQSDVIVTVCATEQIQQARRLLRPDLAASGPVADGWFDSVEPSDILVATKCGQIRGAIVAQSARGKVGWLWPPAIAGEAYSSVEYSDIAQRLVRAAVQRLAAAGAHLIQALLRPGQWGGSLFEECGFSHITDMIQLQRRAAEPLRESITLPALDFVSYQSSLEDEFQRTVQDTYIGSKDCPELDGVRSVQDVLDGYRAASEFRPNLWSLARIDGAAAGCVLLCFIANERRCELEYMGVVPTQRRRGVGRGLVLHSLRAAQQIGAESITLAVDARNSAARRLYDSFGFVESDRRIVFIFAVAREKRRDGKLGTV